MPVPPILPLPPVATAEPALMPAMPLQGTAAGAPSGFGQMFSQGIAAMNEKLVATETNLQHLAVGQEQNLHQVMIGMEESRLAFQLFMQVRNRLLGAYDDIMKMQV
jgi:flagellar hook-basal body complex protein FliE